MVALKRADWVGETRMKTVFLSTFTTQTQQPTRQLHFEPPVTRFRRGEIPQRWEILSRRRLTPRCAFVQLVFLVQYWWKTAKYGNRIFAFRVLELKLGETPIAVIGSTICAFRWDSEDSEYRLPSFWIYKSIICCLFYIIYLPPVSYAWEWDGIGCELKHPIQHCRSAGRKLFSFFFLRALTSAHHLFSFALLPSLQNC